MNCYLCSVTKPLILAFELNFEVTLFGHKLALEHEVSGL